MNEYPGEVNFFLQRVQKRPYEYLESMHVLSDRFIGAHSIMLSAHERTLLRERDVKYAIVHLATVQKEFQIRRPFWKKVSA